eukprot:COSAG02_NODE_58894_length_276_cov_0.570621_1_plen_67_part_01
MAGLAASLLAGTTTAFPSRGHSIRLDPAALALVGLVDGDLWEEIMTSCLVVACLILGARARSPVQFP